MTVRRTDRLDWDVRLLVYRAYVEQGEPPTVAELADRVGIAPADVQAVLERLHDRHALFLDPDRRTVRMANPFSAVPTGFRVTVGDRAYWANCAWDMLGIPAALGSDARIEATLADRSRAVVAVRDGAVSGEGHVHFPIPFRRWYDDLVFT
jgi:Alkylmercury lyase